MEQIWRQSSFALHVRAQGEALQPHIPYPNILVADIRNTLASATVYTSVG
jgi:hypothetical protein